MMAATLADGTTVIESAACEPEVTDLAGLSPSPAALHHRSRHVTHYHRKRVKALRGCEHTIILTASRSGTFMVAAAITNGDVKLTNCCLDHLLALVDRLKAVGVNVERSNGTVTVSSSRRLSRSLSRRSLIRASHRPCRPRS